jgi:hypothetical protein
MAVHTLLEENASTSVLKKNEFAFAGEVDDRHDGKVCRWIKPIGSDFRADKSAGHVKT